MSICSDPGDAVRLRYLEEVFARMQSSPKEEERIREKARTLLALTSDRKQAGREFLARWGDLLELPVSELQRRMLVDTPEARELRHAHLFAGALPEQGIRLQDLPDEAVCCDRPSRSCSRNIDASFVPRR